MSNHFGSKAIPTFTLRPVKTDQTCWSNIIQHCYVVLDCVLIIVGLCWLLDAAVFKRFYHHPTILDFSTRHEIGVFLIMRTNVLDDVGWKVWTKSNFIHHRPTLSNTIQHVWLCCSNGSNMLCPIMFYDVWPTCLIMLYKRVKHAVSNNVLWCLTNMFHWTGLKTS